MQEGQPLTVIAHLEVAKEEQDVDAGVKRTLGNQGRLQTVWGNTLYGRDDLPFSQDMSDLPDVFTPFRNKVQLIPHALMLIFQSCPLRLMLCCALFVHVRHVDDLDMVSVAICCPGLCSCSYITATTGRAEVPDT